MNVGFYYMANAVGWARSLCPRADSVFVISAWAKNMFTLHFNVYLTETLNHREEKS